MIIDERVIIKEYGEGKSMHAIAKTYGTYTMTVKRILEKHNVELRHDEIKKGQVHVKNGEKLVEWAKAQGRLVTKEELARVLGRTKLSPSYFIKYPELGKYVETRDRKDLKKYYQALYTWLDDNGISYKSGDKTRLGVIVDVLLLDKYSDIAIQIVSKPRNVSKKTFDDRIAEKVERAKSAKVALIMLTKDNFENLDYVKSVLDDIIADKKRYMRK